MRPFWADLRFGLRLLWRHPSFSIVRGVLLKSLPYRQPEQLRWLAFDPVVLALVCGLLLIVAAARIDPLHALRQD